MKMTARQNIFIFTGSRDWDDPEPVRAILRGLRSRFPKLIIAHGANPNGLDRMAGHHAERIGAGVITFPAAWDLHGPAAGHIRNQEMLDWALQHGLKGVYGFHEDINSKTPRGNKRGTKDMLDRAKKTGVPVYLITTKF
jgi:hypothetical protein